MRIKTVGDLKEALEELDDELPLMAQHQPSWPLREIIGGIWFDDGTSDDDDGCECDHIQSVHGPDGCTVLSCKCVIERGANLDHEKVVYLVLNGHPSQGSPYGDRRAWEAL